MSNYKYLQALIEIDSPTGFTKEASEYIADYLTGLGFKPEYTNKGALKCALSDSPTLALVAHVDTIGAMISGIASNGQIKFSALGGLSINGVEGEYCNIHTHDGDVYTGTLLLNNPSVHANSQTRSEQRSTDNTFIRLDEEITSADDVKKLGISTGDFISFNTKYHASENGYIKSRFLDNKAGCYILMEIARKVAEQKLSLPVELFFSTYEEVGHGGTCGYSETVNELLVVDMGVVGDACEGNEVSCSICAKDSSGPYDYEMRKTLVNLAKDLNIPYVIDIYPFYGSDGSAALRAGNDFKVGLIGPGIAASHGMERTHKKGIEATIDLCMAYVKSK